MNKIKWGIIGLGKIAHKFANDLLLLEDIELEAVASRDISKAASFSKKYYANKHYGSYLELIQDKNVEIIYIATPNNLHQSITVLALQHKKAVLCEKPFAINKTQVLSMIDASKENNTFLMEALWTRFMPAMVEIKKRIDTGEIGELKYINADFAFKAPLTIQRVHDKSLGGGSLLDIGIYPIFLSYFLLGNPIKIMASATYFDSGVDSQLAMIFNYKNAQALLFSSFNSSSKRVAKISGTLGEIIINNPWNETVCFTLTKDEKKQKFEYPKLGKGYTHEIIECNKCLNNGKIESNLWSHNHSIELISLLDLVRKEINLTYFED
ncbi:Gfo/Idh/MocA family oxidoreductase [uncultured Lutibacter sp.]|uniref:Gfo/Idh/MocA family oxidoreductase n=1 Tax=Lutibacter sp. TaxID=1925666 RepID=UPI00262ACEAB|nr:Gfo/Idh/MocA family oxidoreductase [uncultured Lutibacter sp.]